jgi:hypothetical protein
LLYTRPHHGDDEQLGARPQHDLLLRDVLTGEDILVPTGPYPDGWESACVRFNPFDPQGKRMAVIAPALQEAGTSVVVFGVTERTVSATGVAGRFAFALFDRSGDRLVAVQDAEVFVVTLPSLERRKLDLSDEVVRAYPHSMCPAADVLCLYQVRLVPGERRGVQAISLYDVDSGAKVADLPTHPEDSQLDDLATQWTADGRYVCFLDRLDNNRKDVMGTRVWDRVSGEEKPTVPDTAPMGPGPEGPYIVLVRTLRGDNRPILHDAATGRSWILGDANLRLLHAAGGRAVYLKTDADGSQTVRVAEITLPGAEE